MSCNGCRVLRKGCSDACMLRSCLRDIATAEAQSNATIFVAKFFGRAALMNLISAVADDNRPALFQSLLFEACGRTINPVTGAVGLLCSGEWSTCEAAVETVLRRGSIAGYRSGGSGTVRYDTCTSVGSATTSGREEGSPKLLNLFD